MADRRQSKPRQKWIDQMNADLLWCKREAVAMTQMDQPPLDSSGRRKGYIKIRKELWDAKGYDGFGFSIQNLRDQRKDSKKRRSELRKYSNDFLTRDTCNQFFPRNFCFFEWLHGSEFRIAHHGFIQSRRFTYD